MGHSRYDTTIQDLRGKEMFYIGCPMWGYKEWVGDFFPARTQSSEFLRLYSQKLTTVEGNTVFYATPSADTVRRWAQETPPTFRFCPKVARSISHEPDLATKKAETLAFIERMREFGQRLGPMFLQLPPSFGPAQLSQLQTFLEYWPTDIRLAVEVRHPEFYQQHPEEVLNTLLREHNIARVIMDTRPIRTGSTQEQQMLQARERKPDLPVHITTTADFAFVRYIGHPRMEVNEPFLEQWKSQLVQWFKQGTTIYIFCHCPFEEHSPRICFELYRRLQAQIHLPPLTWEPGKHEGTPEQMRLF